MRWPKDASKKDMRSPSFVVVTREGLLVLILNINGENVLDMLME
jgi:hypothetical protein